MQKASQHAPAISKCKSVGMNFASETSQEMTLTANARILASQVVARMALIPKDQGARAKLAATERDAGTARNLITSVSVLRAKLKKLSCAGMESLVMTTARVPSVVRRLIKSAGTKAIVAVSVSALSAKEFAGMVKFLK